VKVAAESSRKAASLAQEAIHVAAEGGFPLDDFPKIRGWIERVLEQPKFLPMSTRTL
jgi:hypothetical protein